MQPIGNDFIGLATVNRDNMMNGKCWRRVSFGFDANIRGGTVRIIPAKFGPSTLPVLFLANGLKWGYIGLPVP